MKERIKCIDFFRTMAIINMIIYHTYYDLKYVFLLENKIFDNILWHYQQQYICISFIFLSAISCNYSDNLPKKAFKLMIISVLITLVTVNVSKDLAIYFGVIHFLTVMTVVIFFLKKLRVSPKTSEILFWIFIIIFILLKSKLVLESPAYENLYYSLKKLPFSYVIGFPDDDFYSADYFPIVPWIFLGIAGYYFDRTRIADILKNNFQKIKLPNIIVKISQKSLIIYVLHQVIIYGFLYLIFYLIRR